MVMREEREKKTLKIYRNFNYNIIVTIKKILDEINLMT
jgi:hypothetical protein